MFRHYVQVLFTFGSVHIFFLVPSEKNNNQDYIYQNKACYFNICKYCWLLLHVRYIFMQIAFSYLVIYCVSSKTESYFFYKCISHWNNTKHCNAINRRQTTNIDIQYFDIVASISFSSTRSFFSYSSLICCRRINSCSELSVDFASNFCILC